MKLLVLSHMYPSDINPITGIFVYQQVKALIGGGCEVRVVAPVPATPFPTPYLSGKWRQYAGVPDMESREGIVVYHPRYVAFPRKLRFATSGRRMYAGLRALVQRIRDEFPIDLVHAHQALPDGSAALRLRDDYGTPVVVTLHGNDIYRSALEGRDTRIAVSKVVEGADKIVAVSAALKRLTGERLNTRRDIEVVGNGIDEGIVERSLSGAVKPPDGKPVLVSVAYLIRRKAIDYNLRAVARVRRKFPGLRYIVVGDGPERRDLERLSLELGLQDSVEFVGTATHEEALAYMAMADVFSLPSWDEGFGVVYLEAMAHGVPTIGCRGEGIEDVITHGENGLLVEPRNITQLSAALDRLLSDRSTALKLGSRGRDVVLERFRWRHNAEKMMVLYHALLAERRSTHDPKPRPDHRWPEATAGALS